MQVPQGSLWVISIAFEFKTEKRCIALLFYARDSGCKKHCGRAKDATSIYKGEYNGSFDFGTVIRIW